MFDNLFKPSIVSLTPDELQIKITRLQATKALKIAFQSGVTIESLNKFWDVTLPTKRDIKFLSRYMNDLIVQRNASIINIKRGEISKLADEIRTLAECNAVVHENGQFE